MDAWSPQTTQFFVLAQCPVWPHCVRLFYFTAFCWAAPFPIVNFTKRRAPHRGSEACRSLFSPPVPVFVLATCFCVDLSRTSPEGHANRPSGFPYLREAQWGQARNGMGGELTTLPDMGKPRFLKKTAIPCSPQN